MQPPSRATQANDPARSPATAPEARRREIRLVIPSRMVRSGIPGAATPGISLAALRQVLQAAQRADRVDQAAPLDPKPVERVP
jgi:hypothetical protein